MLFTFAEYTQHLTESCINILTFAAEGIYTHFLVFVSLTILATFYLNTRTLVKLLIKQARCLEIISLKTDSTRSQRGFQNSVVPRKDSVICSLLSDEVIHDEQINYFKTLNKTNSSRQLLLYIIFVIAFGILNVINSISWYWTELEDVTSYATLILQAISVSWLHIWILLPHIMFLLHLDNIYNLQNNTHNQLLLYLKENYTVCKIMDAENPDSKFSCMRNKYSNKCKHTSLSSLRFQYKQIVAYYDEMNIILMYPLSAMHIFMIFCAINNIAYGIAYNSRGNDSTFLVTAIGANSMAMVIWLVQGHLADCICEQVKNGGHMQVW